MECNSLLIKFSNIKLSLPSSKHVYFLFPELPHLLVFWLNEKIEYNSVADPDLELSGGGGGVVSLALLGILPSVISFFTQNMGSLGPPRPLP